MWQAEQGHLFQDPGQGRWTEPWDNPNTFGVLMGVGVILAVGRLVQSRSSADCGLRNAEFSKRSAGGGLNLEPRTSNVEPRTARWGRWLTAGLFGAAAGVTGVGLVKSYSRGAWVGTAVALYLSRLAGWSVFSALRQSTAEYAKYAGREPVRQVRMHLEFFFRVFCVFRGLCGGGGRVALATVVVSIGILGFWNLRHFEGPVARRAVSVANANDFSWRNRVAAWEGALQMMAERPWLGFGWNQPGAGLRSALSVQRSARRRGDSVE